MMRLIVTFFIFLSFNAFSETIGTVSTKGVFFKDKLNIEAFDDPSVSGVPCYTTVHKRALSFTDSSS